MAKIRTNVMELVLNEVLVGKKIYINENTPITIEYVEYQPILGEIYIKSGSDGYKINISRMYDFDLNIASREKIKPNKGRLK